MMPTDEETNAIQEAVASNSDIPLASAEQFLQMMASISGLKSRLSLWLFKADYDSLEEVCRQKVTKAWKKVSDMGLAMARGLEDGGYQSVSWNPD